MNLYFEKTNRIFEKCQRHIYHMDLAHTEIAHLMPLSVETYEKLTDADIKTVDQFLFRFSKLQDATGSTDKKQLSSMIRTQYQLNA